MDELPQNQNAFQVDRDLYHLMFEFSPASIVCVGLNGKFLLVNQAFCDLLGYTREELLERSFQEVTYAGDLPADLEFVRGAIAGKQQAYRREKRYIHKNGSLLWMYLTSMLLRDSAGKPLFFLTVLV
jgi:PAS domain S-box-containing protein